MEYLQSDPHLRALSTFVKLVRCNNSVCNDVHAHFAGKLSVSQFGILEALLHLGPMSQKDLAEKILKSPGNITTVINNLVRDGLVTRTPQQRDKRFCTIDLTPEGREMIGRLFPRHAEIVRQRFAVLSDSEQNELARLLKKLSAKGAIGSLSSTSQNA